MENRQGSRNLASSDNELLSKQINELKKVAGVNKKSRGNGSQQRNMAYANNQNFIQTNMQQNLMGKSKLFKI